MFWPFKNDLLKILDNTQTQRDALYNHDIYKNIVTIDHLHIFMENHIFAVWDFMSILKSLQNQLTCTNIPWLPAGQGTPARLINEIVTEEETDINFYGEYMSHFEMYLHAMKQAGANTDPINQFLSQVSVNSISNALNNPTIPQPAKKFVTNTFNILDDAPAYVVAAMFTFGREEVIPDMFRSIVKKLDHALKGKLRLFIYYIDRHINMDENEHTPSALRMVKELCSNDENKWIQVNHTAKAALEARINLWDRILKDIKSS